MNAHNDPQIKSSPADFQKLNTWLKGMSSSIFKAHGFLSALACCPTQITTSTWLDALLPGTIPSDTTQTHFTLLHQLRNEIAAKFSHYEVIYPLIDFVPVSPFIAAKLTFTHRKNLAQWCKGYLNGIKLNTSAWRSLQEFKNLTLALRIANDNEVAVDLFGAGNTLSPDSPQVARLVNDMIESIPVLLGIIYDQACEIASVPKDNKKPKKTDINLLYHFRPNAVRSSLHDHAFETQKAKPELQ